MDGFDDDEISRAIALSLQETANSSRKQQHNNPAEVIEIDDDDDDDGGNIVDDEARFQSELRQVMELSKKADTGPSSVSSSRQASIPPRKSASAPAPQPSNNPLLMDRRQLEQERLARQKRLRPEINPSSADVSDDDEEDEEEQERGKNSKRQRLSSTLHSTRRANAASSSTRASTINGAGPSAHSEPIFWDGELRQTANRHVDADKDTLPSFRLSEIIGPKDDIAFAILSAYVIDLPWMYEFFKIRTPVIVVAQDPQGNETMKEVLPEWIKTTPFLRGGRGCMHMKFMLIFYKTGRLRVAVSTANLIPYDWRDIENTVWVQDVPLRAAPIPHSSKANDFPSTLSRILRAVNVVPALLQVIRNKHDDLPIKQLEDLRCKWDFSKVKVFLIPSIAGKHEGWPKVVQTGHTALMKAVIDMGARTGKERELTLECQGSSIGAYTTQWTNEFYGSAKGESAEGWLDQPKARRGRLPYPPLRILFPSARTVKESVAGEPGGGTMFCRRNQWESAKFPRDHFYDSNSKRGKVLMHSKMIIGTFKEVALASSSKSSRKTKSRRADFDSESEHDSDDDIVEVAPRQENLVGWAYVGSHNFTPSAWGTLSGSGFNPVLNITNYELGVAFPLRSEKELEQVACWKRPARKYVSGRDEPWIQNESPFFAEQ